MVDRGRHAKTPKSNNNNNNNSAGHGPTCIKRAAWESLLHAIL